MPFLLGGCVGSGGSSPAPIAVPSCASCVEARTVNGWCEACDHGYVGGVVIESRQLHEDLDAHGHEIDPLGITCAECAEAVEVDGFCTRCRFGYVDGELYFTVLTWTLHRGTTHLAETLDCDDCRAVHGGVGRCERCGTAWVGHVAFEDLDLHARAAGQFRRMLVAADRIGACELCPSAGFFGRPCPLCGTPAIPDPLPAEGSAPTTPE